MEARLGRVMVERDAAIAERDAALNEVNAIRELLPYSSPLRGGASPPPEPKAAASPDPVVVRLSKPASSLILLSTWSTNDC